MFGRFRQGATRLQVSLVGGRRDGGKVRHEHVAGLGSIVEPMTIVGRPAFWNRLRERLYKLVNRIGDAQGNILDAVHARSLMVAVDVQRALQRENAEADEKFWASFRGKHAATAEGRGEPAATASRAAADAEPRAAEAGKNAAVAKQRLDPPANGEGVSGGLGKPMTREDLIKAAGISTSHANHIMRVAELGE
ncbi:MAG: hypothetical protein WBF43_12485, partial [Methylocella sp.]